MRDIIKKKKPHETNKYTRRFILDLKYFMVSYNNIEIFSRAL